MDHPSGVIRYVMTTRGPQPVGHVDAPIDYGHYVEKQIEPLVRAVAPLCDLDVDAAVRGERDLFRHVDEAPTGDGKKGCAPPPDVL